MYSQVAGIPNNIACRVGGVPEATSTATLRGRNFDMAGMFYENVKLRHVPCTNSNGV